MRTGLLAFTALMVLSLAALVYLGSRLAIERQEHAEAIEAITNEARIERTKGIIIGRIIECESSGRHDAWGDDGRSYGVAQFQRRTFEYLARKAGYIGLDWKNRNDQIALLRWAVDNGEGDNWTCYRRFAEERP